MSTWKSSGKKSSEKKNVGLLDSNRSGGSSGSFNRSRTFVPKKKEKDLMFALKSSEIEEKQANNQKFNTS